MNMETINECSGQIVDAGVRVHYDGTTIDNGYRLDRLVNDLVIVEVKAAVKLAPIHEAVLLTYLRLSNHRLGLIMNFHERRLRDGIRRIINGYQTQVFQHRGHREHREHRELLSLCSPCPLC